jgi:tryptophan synthase beta chain
MSTCKLQGTIVSSKFIQKKGAPIDRASAVVQAVVTRDKFKVKVPQLTTTYTPLPMLPLTEKAKDIIVETESTNSAGKFGRFGGKFVPETLVMCLNQLEAEFKNALRDQVFQVITWKMLISSLF